MIMEEKKFKSISAYHLQKLSNYYSSPIHLEKDSKVSGLFGWAVLVSYILAYDIFAIKTKKTETLTRSFWRLSEGKISKAPVMGLWLAVTFHLMLEKDVRRKINK